MVLVLINAGFSFALLTGGGGRTEQQSAIGLMFGLAAQIVVCGLGALVAVVRAIAKRSSAGWIVAYMLVGVVTIMWGTLLGLAMLGMRWN